MAWFWLVSKNHGKFLAGFDLPFLEFFFICPSTSGVTVDPLVNDSFNGINPEEALPFNFISSDNPPQNMNHCVEPSISGDN